MSAIKFEVARLHFLSDVFVAVAVVKASEQLLGRWRKARDNREKGKESFVLAPQILPERENLEDTSQDI